MRRLVLIALLGLLAGAGAQLALREPAPGCGSRALLDQGTLRGDGVFLAVMTAGCGEARSCTVADATKPIAREIVPAGVAQDCVAFNQYIGAGLNAIPGYLTGECFSRAEVAPPARTIHPEHRCEAR